MKIPRLFLYSIVVTAFVVTGSAGSGSMRTFTDASGRTIEGTILSGTAETVVIAVAGGKEFTLPIAKFSEADQKYIREWVAANPAARSYKLQLTETAQRLDREQRKTGEIEVTEEKWIYVMKLRNLSPEGAEGLEVRYRVFISTAPRGTSKDRPIRTVDGGKKIEALKSNAEAEVRTLPVALTETLLTGASGGYADGSSNRKKEELEGIWVKVFRDGARVWEAKSGKNSVKSAEWPDETALKVALDDAAK